MRFDNASSEMIDNDVEVLIPLNNSHVTPAQAVTRSISARQIKRHAKKHKSNHNSNNNYEIDNKGHQQISIIKIFRLQQKIINNNSNTNNNQYNDKTSVLTNHRVYPR